MRLNSQDHYTNLQLLLYSLGVGPVLTSLILYYLFLLFPRNTSLFYFLALLVVYSGLSIYCKRQFHLLWCTFTAKIKAVNVTFKTLSLSKRMEYIVFPLILCVLFIAFLVPYLTNTLHLPLDETDALKYGVLGKYFFEEKSLEARWIRANPKTGFYFQANSAPSFSLLLTWEKTLDSFFSVNKDLFYKSMSAYYALLILGVFVYHFSKKNKGLAIFAVLALLSGHAFFRTLFQQHLDSYRIFLLIISWIFLKYAVEKRDVLSVWVFALFSGFAAFAHTIGAIVVILNVFVFFLFFKTTLKNRIKQTLAVISVIIFFGWLHYLIDIFWGFGWLIFNRNVTWWG